MVARNGSAVSGHADYGARMASRERSTWPLVLFLGLCVATFLGSAVAVAGPSDSGRPWWHEDVPQPVTGTVLSVDDDGRTIVLDGLVVYRPEVRGGIGTLTVEVAEPGEVRVGDTVDVVVTRDDGHWAADELTILDTD